MSFTERWRTSINSYIADSDWDASAASDDAILVHTSDGVVCLDGASGAVLWTGAGTYAHPAHRLRPLYRALDLQRARRLDSVVEIDPATGKDVRVVAFDSPVRGFNLRLYAGSDVLLVGARHAGQNELTAIDAATGKARWRVPIESSDLWAPLFLGDRIVVRAPYQAYALSDGKRLWSINGACCDMAAVSDGSRVFIRTSERPDEFVEVDRQGKQQRSFSGRLLAADDEHLVYATGHSLRVAEHTSGETIVDLPYALDQAGTAVSFAGNALYYFDPGSNTVWRHDVKSGARTVVVVLTKSVHITTERAGVLEPFLSKPPLVSGRRVYLYDHAVRAFEASTGQP